MAFEWQQRDQAAETLGVDVQTLQAWIDSGKAPSRLVNGQHEVLIEFPEDDPATENPAAEAPATGTPDTENTSPGPTAQASSASSASSGSASGKSEKSGKPGKSGKGEGGGKGKKKKKGGGQREEAPGAGSTGRRVEEPETVHEINPEQSDTTELVHRRELQMAGGMVAAWQRLAESADQELVRSRRLGIVAWSLVAVLVVAGATGLWWTTRELTDARNKITSTREQLTTAQDRLSEAEREQTARTERLEEMRSRIQGLQQELTKAEARLAELQERADQYASRAEELAAQNRDNRQTAEKQAESSQTAVTALRETLKEQRELISSLESRIGDAKQGLAEAEDASEAATNANSDDAAEADGKSTEESASKTAPADTAAKNGEPEKKGESPSSTSPTEPTEAAGETSDEGGILPPLRRPDARADQPRNNAFIELVERSRIGPTDRPAPSNPPKSANTSNE